MPAKSAIFTEEEAAWKWCPHAVASHTDPRGGFHYDPADKREPTFGCLGGRCMAWRWYETHVMESGEFVLNGNTYGYCGLSGRPDPVMARHGE